jgi:hypothetical protein
MVKDKSLEALRQKEGRGKLLIIVLIIVAIEVIAGLASLPEALSNPPSRLFIGGYYSVIYTLVEAAILVGLWKWQKTAAYAFFAFFLWTTSISFATGFSTAAEEVKQLSVVLTIGVPIVAFGLLASFYFWTFKRKWHLFG